MKGINAYNRKECSFGGRNPKQSPSRSGSRRLRKCGFLVATAAAGHVMVSRGGCAALLEASPDGAPRFAEPPGLLIGDSIAKLIDGGFQKFFLTADGKRKPALAFELKGDARISRKICAKRWG